MKNIILPIFILLSSGLGCFAQCDKNVSYTASKVEFLDTNGKVEHTDEGKVVVAINKKEIIIDHDGHEEDKLKGIIKEVTCNWKDAFKNGRSIINAELTEANGASRDAVLTIEGKDGKLTILLNLQGKKINILVDEYEEKS